MGRTELENLVRIRQLKAEPGTKVEMTGLLHSGSARLEDALNLDLNIESRFDLAYSAAHAFSLAALRWHGFRSENRFTVFQSLTHTVGLAPEQWRVLDQAHRKRNLSEYEGDVDIDEALLSALLRVTAEVADRVRKLGPPQTGS